MTTPRYTFERIDPETNKPLYKPDPHGAFEMDSQGNIVPHEHFWARVKDHIDNAVNAVGEAAGDAKFGG